MQIGLDGGLDFALRLSLFELDHDALRELAQVYRRAIDVAPADARQFEHGLDQLRHAPGASSYAL